MAKRANFSLHFFSFHIETIEAFGVKDTKNVMQVCTEKQHMIAINGILVGWMVYTANTYYMRSHKKLLSMAKDYKWIFEKQKKNRRKISETPRVSEKTKTDEE